jgi:hypothetical protein
MYNDNILEWLFRVSEADYLNKKKLDKAYYVGNESTKIYFDLSTSPAKFSVIGSPYLIAMVKWFQQELLNNEDAGVPNYNLPMLIDTFSLPFNKRQDAMFLLELTGKIKNEY